MSIIRLAVSGWWIALIVLAVTVGASTYATSQRERVYRAASTLTVVPSDSVLGSREATINSINVLDRRTIPNTFAEIARSRSMLEAAGRKAGYAEADLRTVQSSAVVLPETFVVRITVDADAPEKAAVLANGVLEEAGVYGLSAYPSYQARALDQAVPTTTPVSPQPVRDIGVAAIVGLASGFLAAFVVRYLWTAGSRRTSRDGRRRGARPAVEAR
jgi:capsular polysaccharide biosynthesis protein